MEPKTDDTEEHRMYTALRRAAAALIVLGSACMPAAADSPVHRDTTPANLAVKDEGRVSPELARWLQAARQQETAGRLDEADRAYRHVIAEIETGYVMEDPAHPGQAVPWLRRWVGIREWCRTRVAAIAEATPQRNLERYGAPAEAALARARRDDDTAQLGALIRAYPGTPAAAAALAELAGRHLAAGRLHAARARLSELLALPAPPPGTSRRTTLGLLTRTGQAVDPAWSAALDEEALQYRMLLALAGMGPAPAADAGAWLFGEADGPAPLPGETPGAREAAAPTLAAAPEWSRQLPGQSRGVQFDREEQQQVMRSGHPAPLAIVDQFPIADPVLLNAAVWVPDVLGAVAVDAETGELLPRRYSSYIGQRPFGNPPRIVGHAGVDGDHLAATMAYMPDWVTDEPDPDTGEGRLRGLLMQAGSRTIPALRTRLGPFVFDTARGAHMAARPGRMSAEVRALLQDSHFVSAPLLDGDRLYGLLLSSTSEITTRAVCIEWTTGRLLWERTMGFEVQGRFRGRVETAKPAQAPVMSGDTVVFANNRGLVAAMDTESGDVRWLVRYGASSNEGPVPGQWATRAPVVVGRNLFVAPLDTDVMMVLDLRTGRHVSELSRRWGGPVHPAQVEVGGGRLRWMFPDAEGRVFLAGRGIQVIDGRVGAWPSTSLSSPPGDPFAEDVSALRMQLLTYPTEAITDASTAMLPEQALGRGFAVDGIAFVPVAGGVVRWRPGEPPRRQAWANPRPDADMAEHAMSAANLLHAGERVYRLARWGDQTWLEGFRAGEGE